MCEFVLHEHRRTRAALGHLHPREATMQRSGLCSRLQTVRVDGGPRPGGGSADPVAPARRSEACPVAAWTDRIGEASEPLHEDVARWEMRVSA